MGMGMGGPAAIMPAPGSMPGMGMGMGGFMSAPNQGMGMMRPPGMF
jgi:hypothetical protein